jgi:peptidoglycan/xylan/chitin deacetylase (PgdA/CDA1 family)
MGLSRAQLADVAKRVLHASGALHLSRQWRPTATAVILRYHSVGDDHGPEPFYIAPSLSIPRQGFDAQMRFLRERYRPTALDEIVEAIRTDRPLPAGAVAVTFDDGYRDNYTHAFPVLRKFGIPATFYITTGCVEDGEVLWTSKLRYYFMASSARALEVAALGASPLDLGSTAARHAIFERTIALIKTLGGARGEALFREVEARLGVTDLGPLRRAMMTWDEIQELSRGGMTIGAHTITHPNLPGLPRQSAEAEILGSKIQLEEKIKVPVRHFAYPNGRGVRHFNDDVVGLVRGAGFVSSVTSIDGPVRRGDDPLRLQRLGIYRKHARIFSLALDMERTRLF